MKLSEQFAAQDCEHHGSQTKQTADAAVALAVRVVPARAADGAVREPSFFQPGDKVRIRGEKAVLVVVRVMPGPGDWVAVKNGPYVGHAITAGSLEKVES